MIIYVHQRHFISLSSVYKILGQSTSKFLYKINRARRHPSTQSKSNHLHTKIRRERGRRDGTSITVCPRRGYTPCERRTTAVAQKKTTPVRQSSRQPPTGCRATKRRSNAHVHLRFVYASCIYIRPPAALHIKVNCVEHI